MVRGLMSNIFSGAPALSWSRAGLIGVLSSVVLGCGSSSDSGAGYALQYPTLAEHAQMQDGHFESFLSNDLLGTNGTPITVDEVKNMVIGTKIDTANSRFLVRPVFDLSLLNQDRYLDVNLDSSTQAVTEMRLTSSKSATTQSEQQRYDFTASARGAGAKASAAYHQENKRQEASSDGTVNVKMSYNTTGAYVELLTSGFSGDANFTPYLIGTKLADDAVKTYIGYTESPVPGGSGDKYISDLFISDKQPDAENVYGNIQLLGEMERVFGLLKDQYARYANDHVRASSLENMAKMKVAITRAIYAFYAYHGDAFVSRVSAMNYGLGSGELKFGDSTITKENVYNAALSVSYSRVGFGGSASADVGASRQNGWASAYKNMTITARSVPAGVIDTTSWATSLAGMLGNESSPISVPPLNGLPVLGTLTLPEPVELRKESATPPDTAFEAYDDWKRYQDAKKASPNQDEAQAAVAGGNVAEQGVQAAMGAGGSADAQLYRSYARELASLKNRRTVAALPQPNNIMRVDKMFVSGFRTTPYDRVIPQLRPNLDIPGQSAKVGGFPNVSTLLLVVDKLGQLDSYLRFLSGLAASKVSPETADGYDRFYASFRESAFDMIGLQLRQGSDITDKTLASFGVHWLGQQGSERDSQLYAAFNNIDVYQYIINTLLAPANAKIWSSAPGGYIPFVWNEQDQLSFLDVSGISNGKPVQSLVPYVDPMKNPLSFYASSKAGFKSPWFPVFQYRQSDPAVLLFLQTAGPYQIIRGAWYSAYPGGTTSFSQMNPATSASVSSYLADYLGGDRGANGFTGWGDPLVKWDYSLYFANATQKDRDMVRKYAALTLATESATITPKPNGDMGSYVAALTPASLGNLWSAKGGKTAYKTANGSISIVNMAAEHPYYSANISSVVMLLPINSTTCGDQFASAFSYATDFAPTDIVHGSTYEAAYKAALMRSE